MVDARLSRTELRKNVINPICKLSINQSISIRDKKNSDANYRKFRIRVGGEEEFALEKFAIMDAQPK